VQVQFILSVLIGEMFAANLLGLILNTPVEIVVSSLFGWFAVIRIIVFFYIVVITKHLKVIDLDTPPQYWYCLSGISLLLVIAGSSSGIINEFAKVESYPFFLLMLGIFLALNILTLYLFKTICTISKNEQELHAIEVNYQAYNNIVEYVEKSTQQLNALRHDMKNFQATMIALVKKQKYEDLLEYLDNCAEELYDISPDQDRLSGNTMIDTIFITEMNKIQGKVETEFQIANLSEIEFKANHKDVCSILVNLLDNAIEAVLKIKDPAKRILKVSIYPYKNYVCFSFSNTFVALPKQTNGKFITSKSDKNLHGFGIRSVKDTVSRNHGLCQFEIHENLFTVQVMLPSKSLI
jgi:hypothetical protein